MFVHEDTLRQYRDLIRSTYEVTKIGASMPTIKALIPHLNDVEKTTLLKVIAQKGEEACERSLATVKHFIGSEKKKKHGLSQLGIYFAMLGEDQTILAQAVVKYL